MIIVLYFLISLLVIWEVIFRWRNSEPIKSLQEFNSISRLPVLGSIFVYRYYKGDLRETILYITRRIFSYEAYVLWLSYLPFVIISKMQDLQMVFSKTSHRYLFGLPEKFIGDGIVSKSYSLWKKTRRLMNPAFGPSMMVHYLAVFNKQSSLLVSILKRKVSDDITFNAWPFMINANIDTIVENTIGVDIGTQENSKNSFSEAVLGIMEMGFKLVQFPWLFLVPYLPEFVYNLSGGNEYLKELKRLPAEMIKHKKWEKENKNQSTSESTFDKTILEILLRAHEIDPYFTEHQVCNEILHVFIAGSETTAVIGSFLLLHLGIAQDVQVAQKVYEEIKTVCGNEGTVKMEHIHELDFIEQCIMETIRMYPVISIISRSTNREALTISGDKEIPPYSTIICLLKLVHENPKFYPNPKQWNPENFSKENIEKRPKSSFVGFGGGSRSCIGYKYAIISLKTTLCYVLSNFHVFADMKAEDIETTADLVIRSKHGYPIRLRPRTCGNSSGSINC